MAAGSLGTPPVGAPSDPQVLEPNPDEVLPICQILLSVPRANTRRVDDPSDAAAGSPPTVPPEENSTIRGAREPTSCPIDRNGAHRFIVRYISMSAARSPAVTRSVVL